MFQGLFALLGWGVGGLFGAAGAAWGWLTGSLLGALFFNNKVSSNGVKLKDLKQDTSEYGIQLPILYGTDMLGAIIVATTELVPYTVKVKVGDKILFGFDVGDIKQSVTKYKVSFICLLCEGPIDSIDCIIANETKILYDVRTGVADEETIANSGKWKTNHMDIFLGTDDQEMSAACKALFTNHPEYRGRAGFFIRDLPVEEFGNTTPSLMAIASNYSVTYPDTWKDQVSESGEGYVVPASMSYDCISLALCEFGGYLYAMGGWNEESGALGRVFKTKDGLTWYEVACTFLPRYNFHATTIGSRMAIFGGADEDDNTLDDQNKIIQFTENGENWTDYALPANYWLSTPFPKDDYAMCVHELDGGIYLYGGQCEGAAVGDGHAPPGGSDEAEGGSGGLYMDIWRSYNFISWQKISDDVIGGGAYPRIGATMVSFKDNLYLFGGYNPDMKGKFQYLLNSCFVYDDSGVNIQFKMCASDIVQTGTYDTSYIIGGFVWRERIVAVATVDVGYDLVFWESEDGRKWVPLHKSKYKINSGSVGLTEEITLVGDKTEEFVQYDIVSIFDGDVWKNHRYVSETPTYDEETNLTTIVLVNSVTIGEDNHTVCPNDSFDPPSSWGNAYIYHHLMTGVAGTDIFTYDAPQASASFKNMMFLYGSLSDGHSNKVFVSKAERITEYKVKCSDVARDIITRTERLTEERIDVTDLEEKEITGYSINTRPSAADALSPILQLLPSDVCQSDGKIKIVKRATHGTVYDFTEDDLGAKLSGEQSPERLKIDMDKSLSIPRVLEVIAKDSSLTYYETVQIAQQGSGKNDEKKTVNSPIVMSADEAAQLANMLLYETSLGAVSELYLRTPFMFLDPTDLINVTYQSRTYPMRIKSVDMDLFGKLLLKASLEDETIYNQSEISGVTTEVPDRKNMQLSMDITGIFMNLPAFKETDNDCGFGLAVYPTDSDDAENWTPCDLIFSEASDGEYYFLGEQITEISTVGTTKSVLGTARAGLIDRKNTLTVQVQSYKTLSSCTEEELLGGANLALIRHTDGAVWELIQFQNATESGDDYILDTLTRGRFGTEWGIVEHPVGCEFIMMDDIARFHLSRIYDGDLYFKIVQSGVLTHDNIDPVTFSPTGESKKPYSPVGLDAEKLSSGDWLLSWVRRARISNEIDSDTDIPLDESKEYYHIEFFEEDGSYVYDDREIGVPKLEYYCHVVSKEGVYAKPSVMTREDILAERDWIRFRVTQIGDYLEGYPSDIKEVRA